MRDEAERKERARWPGELTSPEVAHIPTGTRCNNACTFCMERGAGYPFVYSEAEYRQILERQRRDLDAVVFTGGEPTLNPLLPRLVAAARELGYRSIGLVTNGRALRRESLCDELLADGLNAVTLSIHGPKASVHDGIVRRRGAFEQAAQGLAHLASRRQDFGFSLKLNCTLVKQNLHRMAEMRAFADELGIDQVNFNVPEPRGTADELFESVVPRYAAVMDQADRCGLDFHDSRQSLSWVPPCAGGVEWVQEIWHLAYRDRVDVYRSREGKVQGPLCETCAIADHCDGIWERYVAGYGWEEFTPWVTPSDCGDRVLRVVSHAPCNNHCEHCVDGPAAPDAGTDRHPSRQLREGIILGYRSVELAGGEVLMCEELPLLVGQARNLGYERVAIETNGRLLNLGTTLDRLEALGPSEVVIRLNAGEEATHDAMARVSGAFRQTARGMLQLAKRHMIFTVRLRRTETNASSIERARQLAIQAGAARFEVVD